MSAWMEQVKAMARRVIRFIHQELWEVELNALPPHRRFLVRILRTGHLVIRGIKHDNIPLHASALTLGTLISIVPILAITFALYKGLGAGQEDVQSMVVEWMADMPEEFQNFILDMLEQYAAVNFAAMGGIFLALVIFIVVKMLTSIEESFNRVWYISDSRNIVRRISNYISILVIVPILILAAGAAMAIVDAFFSEQMASVAWIYRSLLRLTPLFAAWIAFTFLYMFVPNTRVRIGPGLISGFVGALMWLGWQKIYIAFQFGISKHNAIYGTFASVPVFLGWLYVSWIILLLGAEVAFSVQNSETYRVQRTTSDASVSAKLMVALGIMQRAAAALSGNGAVFDAPLFARDRKVPIRLVNEMIRLFERANLIGALAERPGHFVLLRAPEELTVREVLETVLRDGASPEELGLDRMDEMVKKVWSEWNAGVEQRLDHMTVKALTGAA